MKTFIQTLSAVALIAMTMGFTSKAQDKDGHELVSLWKSFHSAVDNDKPKEQTDILDRIKKEAKSRHLVWDYYDACDKYVESAGSRDWKHSEERRADREREIEELGEPVASFFLKQSGWSAEAGELLDFVTGNRQKLLSGKNVQFYEHDGFLSRDGFGEMLRPLLANDYEYALWSMMLKGAGDESVKERLKAEATGHFSGSYPMDGLTEYVTGIRGRSDNKDACDAFIARHEGKAVSLLAKQELLLDRYRSLKRQPEGTSAMFLALKKDCETFVDGQKKFPGTEKSIAGCCTCPEQILDELTCKKAGYDIKDGKLTLTMRNLDKVRFQILDGKDKVFDRVIDNPALSFYSMDTVRVGLPVLGDADYDIVLRADGIDDKEGRYIKRSLSIATRKNAGGYGVFVADHITGEPEKCVDLTLKDPEGKVLAEFKGLGLNGFTDIPGNMAKVLEKNGRWVTLEASCKGADGILRRSPEEHIYNYRYGSGNDTEEREFCRIFTDRSAFNPDETVHFKAVLYSGILRYKAMAGKNVQISLTDAGNNEVGTIQATTNEFGSAAGEFVLKRGRRNGRYTISVIYGGRTLAQKRIDVDDFVLPTFALDWDRDDTRFHPGDTAVVSGCIKSYSGHTLGAADITYTVSRSGQDIASGRLDTDTMGNFRITVPTDKQDNWQYYQVTVKVVDATGETLEFSRSFSVRKPDEKPVEYFFEPVDENGRGIALRTVAGRKPVWAVVELYGTGGEILDRRMVTMKPEGDAPASSVIRYDYLGKYPDVLTLNVLYFQNSNSYQYSHTVRRPDDSWKIPVKFSRFLDTTLPGATYTFSVSAAPGTECVASVFDKSTETIMGNVWTAIEPGLMPATSLNYSCSSGEDFCSYPIYDRGPAIPLFTDNVKASGHVIGFGRRMLSKAVAMNASNDAMVYAEALEVRDDGLAVTVEEAMAEDIRENGYIRENFANTIAWEPFLKSDADGNINFRFTNADKLSTYYVQMFVHDPSMNNGTVRREMKVTLPVKIAVVQPQLLYEGDRYVMNTTLSNNMDKEISGKVAVTLPDGSVKEWKVSIPAGGTSSTGHEIPVLKAEDMDIRISFTADNAEYGSDGVLIRIPVRKASQEITEAHSALLLAGEDRGALIERLRAEFVNLPGGDAAVRDISIRQMLEEAVPERIEPKSDNVVALTEALLASYLLDGLKHGKAAADGDSPVLEKIMACRNEDGGFAWFKGMDSSPILTALVLQRFALMDMKDRCAESVSYLDKAYFSINRRPYWCGWITLQQYIYVRSLYAEVPFSAKGIGSKEWKEFRQDVKTYLTPAKERGLNGMILAKARRVKTLQALGGSPDGISLAKSWGIRTATGSRLEKSLGKDIASLAEYAVPHRSGGYFFPNAVMPWRGLIESELYAHTMLCDLMEESGHGDIADGVRLWMMVQKETQQWGDDPAFIEALNSVFHGSEEMLDTKVVALKGSTYIPFGDIKAAGNGFSVERSYYRDGKLLKDGDRIHAGDRITAKYSIRNEENRSFVRLTAPRCAALRPVGQTSGYGWGYYRSVLADRTEFWFDSYPEEKTTRTEEFHVTQEGEFQSPVTTIECLYADHYRANDKGGAAMSVK